MKLNLLWVTAALALAVCLPGYQNRLAAEEQSGEASAEADANQADGEASAEASNSADAQPQSSTQSDGQKSSDATTKSDAQSSTSSDVSSSQSTTADTSVPQDKSASSTSSDKQSSQSTSSSRPAPSSKTDASATQSGDRSVANQNQKSTQAGASTKDRARADADVSVQGRANVDARARHGRQLDMRRGIQFGRASDRGLTINNVERNSIYFDSGFRHGDLIVSLHGRPIRSEADFMRWVVLRPGQRVPVIVLRDGQRETIYVEYPREVAHTDRGSQAYLGVTFDGQVRDAVIVRSVAPGSPAEEAGLQRGDMIVALNGEQVMAYPDAISVIRSMQPGERLDILLKRGRSERQTEAVLAGQPRGPVRTATRDSEIYGEQRQVAPVLQPEGPRIIIDRRLRD